MEMNVHNIYPLDVEKSFTEDEAYELVNLFLAITPKVKNKINILNSRLEQLKHDDDLSLEIQDQINENIHKWSEKVRRLGGIPLALYKIKIPSTDGHFVWEFPKADLEFYS